MKKKKRKYYIYGQFHRMVKWAQAQVYNKMTWQKFGLPNLKKYPHLVLSLFLFPF